VPTVRRLLGDSDRRAYFAPRHARTDRVGSELSLDRIQFAAQFTQSLELTRGIAARDDAHHQGFHL
jgi:hypothetical protein